MQAIIPVNLPENSYNIAICAGSLNQLGTTLKPLNLGKKILLVSNPEIFNHYGETVINSLETALFQTATHTIPAGETYKTLDSIAKIYHTALENRLERSSTMVALGGGVVGDMTGFAAATWLRGINFVQVPTSLLAMVDAAIGGKTGVNHPQGKNLIGAFYQPRLVFIDPLVLKTLPVREFRAGMAEVIKYAIIWDQDLFTHLEEAPSLDNLSSLSAALLQRIITNSCQAKADVVGKDEKEAGLRAILNYGHTIGHAVESLTGYSVINHGEAVAIGMVAAGEIAVKLGMWTQEEAKRQNILIEKTGLPTKIPSNLATQAIIDTLATDKKVKAGKVRFILPTQIGKVTIIDNVSSELLFQVIEELK
ncbi:MAG: 3-dehydroquinate synthase [Gomphosphaeria aponina SAG 52.96 = DSM 107014]|uniref:3-dehydroquinate synthase n=1 Tax=Gomphosphaeria aponina SAG 52.96 = DSM 107014 TaxID=1521640 RepID=A0A941GQQ5_9CHRO|nr:3-dehydroquinate synthase [Gomphosphaeria aponina SAG 52.96 = DSM 107014]